MTKVKFDLSVERKETDLFSLEAGLYVGVYDSDPWGNPRTDARNVLIIEPGGDGNILLVFDDGTVGDTFDPADIRDVHHVAELKIKAGRLV